MAAVYGSGGGSPIYPLKYSKGFVPLYQYYTQTLPKFGKNPVSIRKLGSTYLSLSNDKAPASGIVHLNPGRNLMLQSGRGMSQFFVIRSQKMNEDVLYDYVVGTALGVIPLIKDMPVFVGNANYDTKDMMLPLPKDIASISGKKVVYPPFFFAVTYKGKDDFKIDSCINSTVNVLLSLMFIPEVNIDEVSEIMESNVIALRQMSAGGVVQKEFKVTLKGEIKPLSVKLRGNEEYYVVNADEIAEEVSIEETLITGNDIPGTNKPLPVQLYMMVKTSLALYLKRYGR